MMFFLYICFLTDIFRMVLVPSQWIDALNPLSEKGHISLIGNPCPLHRIYCLKIFLFLTDSTVAEGSDSDVLCCTLSHTCIDNNLKLAECSAMTTIINHYHEINPLFDLGSSPIPKHWCVISHKTRQLEWVVFAKTQFFQQFEQIKWEPLV